MSEARMSQQVAEALVGIGAVSFPIDNPRVLKSGLFSPIYIDNRELPSHLSEWTIVLNAFVRAIEVHDIHMDMLAAIETGAIPHSSVLGYRLYKPAVYIRKAVKDHGLGKIIEGGSVQGKHVLLVEDHVSTGGSSLRGVEPLRNSGASVDTCLAITSYGFLETMAEFVRYEVTLITLTDVQAILNASVASSLITDDQRRVVEEWHEDPRTWQPVRV